MSDASLASEVRRRVLNTRDSFWRPEDFDGSPDAVAQALSRLVRSGELRRVRRGLYWRGAATRLGTAPPPPGRFANEVVRGPGTGPAEWSAALALGLSTQVPRREAIAVPGRAPRNTGAVRFVSRAAGTKRRDKRLRPAEVALLEVLRDWDGLVELPTHDAVERIERLADAGTIRLDRLVRASVTEPPRVRERLRRLLQQLGQSTAADAVRPARSESVRYDLALAS
jgi:Transcriptional regulator, AbiEi antitoxin